MKRLFSIIVTMYLLISVTNCHLYNNEVSRRSVIQTINNEKSIIKTLSIELKSEPSRVSLSPNGQWIAYSNLNPYAVILVDMSAANYKERIILEPIYHIEELIWDPSSRYLAVLQVDAEILIYDAVDQETRVFNSDNGVINQLAWSEKGDFFLVAYLASDSAVLFDLISTETLTVKKSFLWPAGYSSSISHMAWTADDSEGTIVFFSQSRLFRYNMKDYKIEELDIFGLCEAGNHDVEWLGGERYLVVGNTIYTLNLYFLEGNRLEDYYQVKKISTGISFDSGKLIKGKLSYVYYIRQEGLYYIDVDEKLTTQLLPIDYIPKYAAFVFDICESGENLLVMDKQNRNITVYSIMD